MQSTLHDNTRTTTRHDPHRALLESANMLEGILASPLNFFCIIRGVAKKVFQQRPEKLLKYL